MLTHFRPAISMFIGFSVLTGIVYPGLITAIAQTFFPNQANGSLIQRGKQLVGSELVGQQFSDAKYFWGRLSATGPMAYNAAASSGSNFGPSNKALIAAAKGRIEALKSHATPDGLVPVDLVTASGSGLDPHISPAAADYQIPRVSKVRNISEESLREIVRRNTQSRQFGLLGEPRVNVLLLNIDLDQLEAPR